MGISFKGQVCTWYDNLCFKIGIVSVVQTDPKAWRLRYLDPVTGRDVRRRLTGLDRREVSAIAAHVSQQILTGKGYLPGRNQTPKLEDGIIQAVQLSGAREGARKGYLRRAKPFLTFMAAQYPGVLTWGQLRPGMVERYTRECERAGLAWDTVRLRLVPIRLAWRRMRLDWPDAVQPAPTIRIDRPPKREIECLTAGELAVLQARQITPQHPGPLKGPRPHGQPRQP